MRKIAINIVLCLSGVLLNMIIYRLFNTLGIPLYMDTVATIAVTFTGGLLCGVLCGALTNIIAHSIIFWSWGDYLFTLCNIATAYITWLFCRFFPNQMNLSKPALTTSPEEVKFPVSQKSGRLSGAMDRIVILILLSSALCFAMSVLGGIITTIIITVNQPLIERSDLPGILSATMFGQNVPLILKEILSRIPINSIDRLISAFAGYTIALGIRALIKKISVLVTCKQDTDRKAK